MNEALELFYYTLDQFIEFIFGAYIFEGVSLGMIWVVSFIFTVLLTFLLAVPRIRVADHRERETSSVTESVVDGKKHVSVSTTRSSSRRL